MKGLKFAPPIFMLYFVIPDRLVPGNLILFMLCITGSEYCWVPCIAVSVYRQVPGNLILRLNSGCNTNNSLNLPYKSYIKLYYTSYKLALRA